jgi:hypothetical protein
VRFRELLEAQDYAAMMLPFVELTHAEGFVRRQIAEVRQALQKNDRIVWFLRLWRIGILAKYVTQWRQKVPADINENDVAKLNNLLKNYEYQYSQASGIHPTEVTNSGLAFATQPRHYLTKLQHFLGLPIPEIQNHVFRYDNPDRLFQTFTAYEDKWKKSRQGMIPQEQAEAGAEVVLRFPNGLAWWLLDREYCQHEADAMGHCGNSGGRKTDRILSLRKTEKRGGQTFHVPYATFILSKDGKLGEMKGRFNNSPKHAFEEGHSPSDFHDEIFALLKLPMITGIVGGGYMPSENFKVTDLPPEQIEALGEIKPQMLPLAIQYKKTGITPALVEQIIAQVSDVRDVSYDEKAKAFIWDARPSLKDFIENYVKTDRNHRHAVALWILDVLQGDEHLESHSDGSGKEGLLDEFKKMHPEDYAQLVAYIERLWDEQHEDFDLDDEDRPDLADMIEEVDDDVDSTLTNALSVGQERGAENEMSEAFDKWLDYLKRPGDFYINLPEWDESYYESACNVMVDVPTIIRLIDDGELEADELFVVDDIQEPYYGFQGYDEESAVEWLRDNLPDMTPVPAEEVQASR